MAKEIKLETKKETTETKEPGKAKVIELTTKKDVADNLDAQKKELKTLEKEESRLNNIEKTTKKAEEDVEKLIELKKGELMKADIEEM